jgi:hypothetical protein
MNSAVKTSRLVRKVEKVEGIIVMSVHQIILNRG